MDFPLADLMDERRCREWLLEQLHPLGLVCPYCTDPHARPVKRPALIPGWRCRTCDRFYTMLTGTVFEKTRQSARTLVLLLQGVAQGKSTSQLAREVKMSRQQVHKLRQRLQTNVFTSRPTQPLPDKVVEVDELYHNAGEKGEPHPDPKDPPRRRGNQRRGRGTADNDRPPIFTVKGRQSREVRFEVAQRADGATCVEVVETHTQGAGTRVNTDEWSGYLPLERKVGVEHKTVKHGAGEHARDEDGDGVREVHSNGGEGENLGLRNFLRVFRGVHKRLLHLYVALYELARFHRCISGAAVRRLCFPAPVSQLGLT
jgi:transposase-like protein